MTMATVKSKTRRDPERTRARILQHATAEFAAKGYNGARVDRIAALCRLSKNNLYHYFGSKEGLFTAVLEQMYARLRARQGDLAIQADDPVGGMRKLVEHTFRAFLEHPETIWLLNEENLHQARHLRRSKRLRALYDPLVGTIEGVLARGVAQGVFRPGIDPARLYLTLSSLAYHFRSNAHTLELALDTDLTSAAAARAWLTHITEVVLLYCQTGAVQDRVARAS